METRHAYGHRRSRKIRLKKILKPRYFNVKVNVTLSDTKDQTEGKPQGSVVSPTFFIMKKKTVARLPKDNRFQTSFYIDDLQISYRHRNCEVVQRKLQDSINIVKKFAQKNGFKFSTNKTFMLQFTKISIQPPIELRLGNINIQKSETIKYLGLVYDSKLDWKAHIQQIKFK